jgi:hypothetical protein
MSNLRGSRSPMAGRCIPRRLMQHRKADAARDADAARRSAAGAFSKPIPARQCRALLEQLGEVRRFTATVKNQSLQARQLTLRSSVLWAQRNR